MGIPASDPVPPEKPHQTPRPFRSRRSLGQLVLLLFPTTALGFLMLKSAIRRPKLFLLLLPLGGIAAAVLIIATSGDTTGDGGPSGGASAASYPSPAPVTFIPPTPLPSDTPVPSLIDAPLPAVTLSTLDGDAISLPDDTAGQVIFLNFWATWCVPCEEEMPALQQLEEERGPDGVRVIAVTDPESGQTEADIRDFIDRYDLTLTVALSSDLALYQTFNVLQIPITYIVDREGMIRYRHIGAMTPDDIAAYLDDLL